MFDGYENVVHLIAVSLMMDDMMSYLTRRQVRQCLFIYYALSP